MNTGSGKVGRSGGLSLDGVQNDTVRRAYEAMEPLSFSDEPLALGLLRKLRERGPLVRGHGYEFPGGFVAPLMFQAEGRPSVLLLTHDLVRRVMMDSETFATPYDDFGPGSTPFNGDGPEHRRIRILLAKGLSPRSIRHWEEDMIRPVAHELIDRFAASGKAELRADFTEMLPVRAIATVLGLPASDLDAFHVLALLQTLGPIHPDGPLARERLDEYFEGQIEDRRGLPGDELETRDDIISLLVKAREGNDRLSNEEIRGTLRSLLLAGTETTNSTLSSALAFLLERPADLAALRDDRTLVPRALEEALRLAPAGAVLARHARVDCELGGVPIAKGTCLVFSMMMANRDPAVWDRPDEFDVRRKSEPHVSFGAGPHMCAGMHLARLEMAVGLNALLDRCRNLRLDPAFPKPKLMGVGMIKATALPVLFDAV